MNKLASIADRFKEPSTYAGLAGLAVLVGLSAEEYQGYVNAIAGVFGFVSVVLAEPGSRK